MKDLGRQPTESNFDVIVVRILGTGNKGSAESSSKTIVKQMKCKRAMTEMTSEGLVRIGT